MIRLVLRCGLLLAVSCATPGVLLAQEPLRTPPTVTPAPHTPVPRPGSPRDDTSALTMVGCLKEEKDVPGRRPSPAERIGIAEDFILTNAQIAGLGPDGGDHAQPDRPRGSASGGGAMFKVRGLDDDRLRSLANQRVEVQGRVIELPAAPNRGYTPDQPAPQPARTDLHEIRASSIRVVSSSCRAGTN